MDKPDAPREFAEFLLSRAGFATVLAVLVLGIVIGGLISVADGKPFLSMKAAHVLLVYSAASFLAASWFGNWSWKVKKPSQALAPSDRPNKPFSC